MNASWFALLLVFLTTYAVVDALDRGDVIAKHNFDGPVEQAIWNKTLGPLVQLAATDKGNQALRITRNQPSSPSTWAFIQLPAFTLRGYKIRIQAIVKAEYISVPPNSWNGIKIMLQTQGPSGNTYPQQNLPQGTFGWRMVDYIASVPMDTQQATLALGLEAVTGVVWFDDIRVTVYAKPRWNANHVRWQLMWNGFPHSPADNGDIPAYETWLESALKHLDSILPLCRQLGIHILIDLHTPPGGRNIDKDCNLFKEKRFQDAFLALWEKIA
jgi:endoglucanase